MPVVRGPRRRGLAQQVLEPPVQRVRASAVPKHLSGCAGYVGSARFDLTDGAAGLEAVGILNPLTVGPQRCELPCSAHRWLGHYAPPALVLAAPDPRCSGPLRALRTSSRSNRSMWPMRWHGTTLPFA